jgi:hypothetical protein
LTQEFIDGIKTARTIISDPAHWCQETIAMDAEGEDVDANLSAARVCALGALSIGTRPLSRQLKYFYASDHVVGRCCPVDAQREGTDLVCCNDGMSPQTRHLSVPEVHAHVLAHFDITVQVLEAIYAAQETSA